MKYVLSHPGGSERHTTFRIVKLGSHFTVTAQKTNETGNSDSIPPLFLLPDQFVSLLPRRARNLKT